jgi:hypothetical protein
VCFLHFAREAAGATGARCFLRPHLRVACALCFQEGEDLAELGCIAPRGRERVTRMLLFPLCPGVDPDVAFFVMAGLVPAIHVFLGSWWDARHKAGHDDDLAK